MSIADKLTYLDTTKQLLKTEINRVNNVLDDNSTFRSYPQELFNGYLDILNNGTDTLWNNLEKVSASGEEATLENVETAPIKMVLNGNTSQETTTGKNLFTTDYLTSNSFTTYTKLTDNSFSFTATGTWKKASYKVPCKPNTNYYFNFSSTLSMYIQIRGVQTGTQIVAVYQAYLTTFNSGENTELQININIGRNSIASGTISDIQLEEGTTATSFEKYTGGQPSPSPDYPQEVKVVKGENVVSVSGKNLLDMSYLVKANADGKTYAGHGFWAFKLSDKIGTYTLSRANADMVSGGSYIAWGEGNDITTAYDRKTWLAHPSVAGLNSQSQVKNNSGELWLFLHANETRIQNIPNDFGYLMLEQGSTATPYVPYSKTDYPISLGTLELCKIGDYKDYFHKDSGKWYVHKEIGKVVLNGSENWSERTNAINVKQFFVGNTIPAVKNITQYCNYFAKYSQTLYNYGGIGDFAILTNSRQFFGCVNSDLTLENFKTLLASNNLIVYYVLATPTEEEITNTTLIEQLEAISKAKSVKDKTYITQTNEELPFILDVEAIKEYSVE